MVSEKGKLGNMPGLIFFVVISFLIALFSVWFFVIKNYTDIASNVNPENTMVKVEMDSTQFPLQLSDTLNADIVDTVSSPQKNITANQEEWNEFKKNKLRAYLAIFKRQAQEENANIARIKQLSKERDSLDQTIQKVAMERDAWKKQMREYKGIAGAVAEEVVAYQKKRDAEKDSLDRIQKKKVLAGNGAGIRKLAKIYESMRPEQAAPILTKLKDDEIINILFKMRQRNAAKVIANFDPGLAARITRKMSGK